MLQKIIESLPAVYEWITSLNSDLQILVWIAVIFGVPIAALALLGLLIWGAQFLIKSIVKFASALFHIPYNYFRNLTNCVELKIDSIVHYHKKKSNFFKERVQESHKDKLYEMNLFFSELSRKLHDHYKIKRSLQEKSRARRAGQKAASFLLQPIPLLTRKISAVEDVPLVSDLLERDVQSSMEEKQACLAETVEDKTVVQDIVERDTSKERECLGHESKTADAQEISYKAAKKILTEEEKRFKAGKRAEKYFSKHAFHEKLYMQPLEQSKESYDTVWKKLLPENTHVKRADYICRNCKNMEFEVKCFTKYKSDDGEYYEIKVYDLMGHRNMQEISGSKVVICIYERNGARFIKSTLRMISLDEIIRRVDLNRYRGFIPADHTVRVYLHEMSMGFKYLLYHKVGIKSLNFKAESLHNASN